MARRVAPDQHQSDRLADAVKAPSVARMIEQVPVSHARAGLLERRRVVEFRDRVATTDLDETRLEAERAAQVGVPGQRHARHGPCVQDAAGQSQGEQQGSPAVRRHGLQVQRGANGRDNGRDA